MRVSSWSWGLNAFVESFHFHIVVCHCTTMELFWRYTLECVVSWKWMYGHDSFVVGSALAGWTRVFVISQCNVKLYGLYKLCMCTDARTPCRKIKIPGWLHVKNKNTYNYAMRVNCLSLFVSLWCIRVNKVALNYKNWQNDYIYVCTYSNVLMNSFWIIKIILFYFSLNKLLVRRLLDNDVRFLKHICSSSEQRDWDFKNQCILIACMRMYLDYWWTDFLHHMN